MNKLPCVKLAEGPSVLSISGHLASSRLEIWQHPDLEPNLINERSKQNFKRKIPNFNLYNAKKQTVPLVSIARELTFELSHFGIAFADSKVPSCTSLTAPQENRKDSLKSFHLNDHSLGFPSQIQTLGPQYVTHGLTVRLKRLIVIHKVTKYLLVIAEKYSENILQGHEGKMKKVLFAEFFFLPAHASLYSRISET